jgi:hypothetical protein
MLKNKKQTFFYWCRDHAFGFGLRLSGNQSWLWRGRPTTKCPERCLVIWITLAGRVPLRSMLPEQI